jgi:hypothetical protein
MHHINRLLTDMNKKRKVVAERIIWWNGSERLQKRTELWHLEEGVGPRCDIYNGDVGDVGISACLFYSYL